MARVKTQLLLDPDFKDFLEYLKELNGTPISRIVEIATKEKYSREFERYMASRGGEKNE